MVFVYFFMVGIIEIFAFILWKIRRKKSRSRDGIQMLLY